MTQPRRTRIIAPIVRAQTTLTSQVDAAIAAGADIVELRVDRIGDVAAVEALLRGPRRCSYVLTIRRAEEGGAWNEDDATRVALYERLGLLMPGYIDIEYATWMRSANLRQKIGLVCETGDADPAGRPKNKLILSHHDLRGTPNDAENIGLLSAMLEQPVAMVKFVTTARDASDALRVLNLAGLAEKAERPLIALAMGEAGLATRALAGCFGLWGSFAAIEPGGESAPGQPTIADLRSLYRWDAQTRRSRLFGVIGWPVSHSRSPRLHNAAMAADGIDGVYVPLPVEPTQAGFDWFMGQTFISAGRRFVGLSVTIPHKEHAIQWLERNAGEISPLATRCGAVNTLVRTPDGGWLGDNTDAGGAWTAIAAAAPSLTAGSQRFRASLLGAGGVARGIAAVLVEHGGRVCIFNRTPDRAERLALELGCDWAPWEERPNRPCDLLVNCTSVGMAPADQDTPFPATGLRSGMAVLDTVYTPPETRLIREARAAGCAVIGGTAMFLAQAAGQYRHWHGREMPGVGVA